MNIRHGQRYRFKCKFLTWPKKANIFMASTTTKVSIHKSNLSSSREISLRIGHAITEWFEKAWTWRPFTRLMLLMSTLKNEQWVFVIINFEITLYTEKTLLDVLVNKIISSLVKQDLYFTLIFDRAIWIRFDILQCHLTHVLKSR